MSRDFLHAYPAIKQFSTTVTIAIYYDRHYKTTPNSKERQTSRS